MGLRQRLRRAEPGHVANGAWREHRELRRKRTPTRTTRYGGILPAGSTRRQRRDLDHLHVRSDGGANVRQCGRMRRDRLYGVLLHAASDGRAAGFYDPKDPNNGQSVPTTTIGTAPTSTTPTSSPTSTCDDKCKLDNGYPCTCNESGCDENSPACCANASCPACDCNESSCSPSSPACCASGTCAWSWTGGGGGSASVSAQFRNGAFANASAPVSVYDIWSTATGTVLGFDGLAGAAAACNQSVAEWRSTSSPGSSSAGLQTAYTNLTVYGDTCDYLAAVATYDGVVPGAQVGSLTCRKWSPAVCYRANYTAVSCGSSGSVAEQLICQWF